MKRRGTRTTGTRPRERTARFLLRLPAELHARLTAGAAQEGRSLNEYCVQRLAGPELLVAPREQVAAVYAYACRVAGAQLLGLIAHGSWVRGEARLASDVDVMIVVDRALPLTRALYRRWDTSRPTWEGRMVDAHFVHLPRASEGAGSVWCELAVEGLVLGDRDGRISAALLDVRRAIAAGRLVRKTSHGQPYWTAA